MQNDDQITAEIFNSTIEGFIIKLLRENELMSFDEIIENASHNIAKLMTIKGVKYKGNIIKIVKSALNCSGICIKDNTMWKLNEVGAFEYEQQKNILIKTSLKNILKQRNRKTRNRPKWNNFLKRKLLLDHIISLYNYYVSNDVEKKDHLDSFIKTISTYAQITTYSELVSNEMLYGIAECYAYFKPLCILLISRKVF